MSLTVMDDIDIKINFEAVTLLIQKVHQVIKIN